MYAGGGAAAEGCQDLAADELRGHDEILIRPVTHGGHFQDKDVCNYRVRSDNIRCNTAICTSMRLRAS
jgi:hypothetical protein